MIAYKKSVRKVQQNVKRAKSNVLLIVPFSVFVMVMVVFTRAVFTLYRISFGPTPQLFRIELLFTHKNGDFNIWRDFCNVAKVRRVDFKSGA